MRRSLWLSLGATLLFGVHAHAQVIHGTVVIDGTSTPIADADVELLAADGSVVSSARSNRHGVFLLIAGKGGDYAVRLSHSAYMPISIERVTVGDAEILQVTLRASQTAIPLAPLDVVVRRPSGGVQGFRARAAENGAFGSFVMRDEIETRPASQPTEFLRMIPGVHLVPVRGETSSVRAHRITLRAGTCAPTIYVDGLRIPDHQTDALDDILSSDMLEGIEVYPVTTPPGLESVLGPGRCGSVAFWTRMQESSRPWDAVRFASALGLFIAGLFLASTIQ